MVAKMGFNASKHEELDVPNLEVIKVLQSLTSCGYVKTWFSWQWYYYHLQLRDSSISVNSLQKLSQRHIANLFILPCSDTTRWHWQWW